MKHTIRHMLRACFVAAALLVCSFATAGEPETYNYKKAIEALQNGEYETAMTLFEQEAKANPKNAYPYVQMGYIHLSATNDYDSALSLFSKALRLFGKDDMKATVQAYCYRAVIYLAKDNEKSALSDLRAAEKVSTTKATDMIIANLYARIGLDDEAITILKKRLALDPNDPELLYKLGNSYMNKDENAASIDCYTRAMSIDDKLSDIYTNRSGAYFFNGDAQKAVDDCLKAVERGEEQEPSCLKMLTMLADTTMTHDLVINGLRPMADADTTGKMANYLAQVYDRDDNAPKDALRYYRLAAERDPNSGYTLSLAQFYKGQGCYEEAIKTAHKAIENELKGDKDEGYLSMLYYKLSGYQYRLEQMDSAMASSDKALEYQDDADGHIWRAFLYLLKGDHTAALADYAKAESLDEEEYSAFTGDDYFYRGYSYLQTGQTELADAAFRKAIEAEKDAPEMGTILSQHFLGLDERAKENAAAHLENFTNKSLAQVNVAMLYAVLGDKTMAAHRIKKALEGDYHNYGFLLHLPFLKDVVAMPEVQQAIQESKVRLEQKKKELLAE